jgi:hypothetical protein
MVNNTITLSTTSLSPFLLTVVPEPSSALLVGFGVVALLSRRLPRRARRC